VAWYDSAWTNRFSVTIDRTKVGESRTQDVLVTEANVPSGFWSAVKADGSDIVVTESDGSTKLKRYVVAIDTSGETLQLRVKVPVSTAADVTIYVYFGNPAASETDDADTFDAELDLPLEEDPGSSNPIDLTGHHSPTRQGTWTSGDRVTGKLGKAWDFDLVENDYLSVPDAPGLDLPSAFTFGFWFRFGDNTTQQYLICKTSFTDDKRSYHITWQNSTNMEWSAALSTNGLGTTNFYKFPQTTSNGTWYFLIVVYDSSASAGNRWKWYTNGSSVSPSVDTEGNGTPYNNNIPLAIGCRVNGGTPEKPIEGQMDEVRIWRRALSSGEVTTRTNNETTPGTFYSCGPIENAPIELAGIATAIASGAGDLHLVLDLAGLGIAVASGLGELQVGELIQLAGVGTALGTGLGELEGGSPFAGGDVLLVVSGALEEVRRIPFRWTRIGQAYEAELELYAPLGHPGPLLWCGENWLEVSVEGGPFQAVGTDRATAVDLGLFPVGSRKSIAIRLTIPPGTDLRSELVRLPLGLGRGY